MRTLVYGGPVFTGLGDQPEENHAVLTNADEIESVGPLKELVARAPEARAIDVRGRTILPGMTDAHRHIIGLTEFNVTPELIVAGALDGVRVAAEALEQGITTVRDPGCKHNGIYEMKRAIENGRIPGPTLYPAGPNPTGGAAPSSWRNIYISGPWEMRQAVRELKRDGAFFLKLVVSVDDRAAGWKQTDWFLTPEELHAGVDEAKNLGLRTTGHVEGLGPARAVVQAGFSAIEHGTSIDEALADTMAERGVFYVPTLTGFSTGLEQWEVPLQPREQAAFQERVAEHRRSFQRALRAGVPIATGTDAYRIPPRECLVNELELMISLGMTPSAALRAATANGAAVLGEQARFGTLSPGKRADLIAVEGNPLENIRALTRVDLVIVRGREHIANGVQIHAHASDLLEAITAHHGTGG